jgi:hypothetical protein
MCLALIHIHKDKYHIISEDTDQKIAIIITEDEFCNIRKLAYFRKYIKSGTIKPLS